MEIETRGAALFSMSILAPTRERYDCGARAVRLRPQTTAGVVSIHLRHADVEKDELRSDLASQLDTTRASIGNMHLVTMKTRQRCEALRYTLVVVDDEYHQEPEGNGRRCGSDIHLAIDDVASACSSGFAESFRGMSLARSEKLRGLHSACSGAARNSCLQRSASRTRDQVARPTLTDPQIEFVGFVSPFWRSTI